VLLGWIIALVGFVYAAVVVTGAQLPKLALILPALGVGAILCAGFGPKRSDLPVLLVLTLVSLYLLVRGSFSPVWDLARRDLFLIISGLLAYLSASSALRLRSGRAFFVAGLIFLVIGNAVVAIHQWKTDPTFSFLNSARSDTLGVSGFYYHRNYLAGFLEISCPILLAAALSRKSPISKFALFVPFGIGVWICFLSNSRGGFGVMTIGCIVVVLMTYFSSSIGVLPSKRKNIVGFAIAGIGVLAFARYGRVLWATIVENRGGAEATMSSLDLRLGLSGLAFDMWLENPLWGMGPESFSYLFPKYFSGLWPGAGDAEMVHSDYLQLLVDYGLIGFLGVSLLIIMMSFLLVRGAGFEVHEHGEGWLRTAAMGVMVAEILRAAVDFNLHIAPNLILFAMALAGGASCNRLLEADEIRLRVSRSSRVLALMLALGGGGYGLYAGWNEVRAVRDWAEIEKLRQGGLTDEIALRNYSEKAPSFSVLKVVARNSLTQALRIESNTGTEFELALEDWGKVVERHPLDGESLANYARCLDEMKRFNEAEIYHIRALEAVSRRENKYGVIYGVGWHFLKRGDALLQQRRPGEALYLFQKAEEAFSTSHKRNFSRREHNRSARQRTKMLIDFLEGARIEPVEVSTLDWQSSID